MELYALIAYVIIGIGAGIIGGLLGLSGGVVTVPSLVLFFHFLDFPQAHLMHLAIGTSLAAMVLNGIASSWTHHMHQGVMWPIVFTMIPGTLLGCLLGAFTADFFSSIFLQIIFGSFIALLGAYVLFRKDTKKTVTRPDRTMYTWIGLGIGTLSSLLGIGGGIFTVPLLLSYKYPEKKAIGTSAAVGLLITFFAAMFYLYFGMNEVLMPNTLGYIYLPAFACVGLGAVFTAPVGAKLAHRIDGKKLRRIFAGTLVIVGVLMIFN